MGSKDAGTFNGNVSPDSANSDNPLDFENVIKKGINGLNLHDFMKLSGLSKENPNVPLAD